MTRTYSLMRMIVRHFVLFGLILYYLSYLIIWINYPLKIYGCSHIKIEYWSGFCSNLWQCNFLLCSFWYFYQIWFRQASILPAINPHLETLHRRKRIKRSVRKPKMTSRWTVWWIMELKIKRFRMSFKSGIIEPQLVHTQTLDHANCGPQPYHMIWTLPYGSYHIIWSVIHMVRMIWAIS